MHGNGGRAAIARIPAFPSPTRSGSTGAPPHGSALAAAAAIATLSPVLSLSPRAARQSFSPIQFAASTCSCRSPAVRSRPPRCRPSRIAQLLALLVVIAAAACAVAVVTALTIQWTRSGARDIDTAVRRAVGASRRDLALSFLGEGARHRRSPRCRSASSSATSPSAWRCAPGPTTLGAWNYLPGGDRDRHGDRAAAWRTASAAVRPGQAPRQSSRPTRSRSFRRSSRSARASRSSLPRRS